MDSNELVTFEIEQFKKGYARKLRFDGLTTSNVDACMRHALADALKLGAKRFNSPYIKKLNSIITPFTGDFIDIAEGKTKISSKADFKKVFNTFKTRFLSTLTSDGLSALAQFGFAQKFINMTFKYLYCFDDCERTNLQYCHLPLDQYTIDWYKQYGDKSIVNRFKAIKFAWANIDETLYWDLQNDIDLILSKGIDYPIDCVDKKQTVRLPFSKIQVEFIVWMQQRLNDIYNKSLSKVKPYYGRLGVKEI